MTNRIWLKAFIYQDHLSRCWYAYIPTNHDNLDAEGSIPASTFETLSEAETALWDAIIVAGERPEYDCRGMPDYEKQENP